MSIKLVLNAQAQLGEGAIWDYVNHRLYWVDILSNRLHIHNPATREDRSYFVGKMVGTVVNAGHNTVLLALADGIATLNLDDGRLTYKLETEIHLEGKRFNDGKCDPQGRFWVGSLSINEALGINKLYCITPDFSILEKMGDLTISNGIAWSIEGDIMYHTDTPTGEITRHDFDKHTGNISNRQVAIRIPSKMGYPDGMTIDCEGMLWVALWDGFCVARFDPRTGNLLQKIDVPVPKVTSCAFGGKDLDVLYITSARCEMSEDELQKFPLSGGLFATHAGVKGVPAFRFNLE